jgi:hypothetical protein
MRFDAPSRRPFGSVLFCGLIGYEGRLPPRPHWGRGSGVRGWVSEIRTRLNIPDICDETSQITRETRVLSIFLSILFILSKHLCHPRFQTEKADGSRTACLTAAPHHSRRLRRSAALPSHHTFVWRFTHLCQPM